MRAFPTLEELLADPDAAAEIAARLAAGPGRCLDDEAFAALFEPRPARGPVAHVLACAACAGRAEVLADALGVVEFERRNAPFPPPARVALFATLSIDDATLDVVRCSGVTRIQPALDMRAGSGNAGVHLRDHDTAPQMEVSLVPAANARRWSAHVRWLRRIDERWSARAFAGGRLLAETPLPPAGAVLASLRFADLRIDVHDGARTVGTAWIDVETP